MIKIILYAVVMFAMVFFIKNIKDNTKQDEKVRITVLNSLR